MGTKRKEWEDGGGGQQPIISEEEWVLRRRLRRQQCTLRRQFVGTFFVAVRYGKARVAKENVVGVAVVIFTPYSSPFSFFHSRSSLTHSLLSLFYRRLPRSCVRAAAAAAAAPHYACMVVEEEEEGEEGGESGYCR